MRIGGGGLLYISSSGYTYMYLILMHISVSIWIILNFNDVQNHLQNKVVLSYSVTASIILEID